MNKYLLSKKKDLVKNVQSSNSHCCEVFAILLNSATQAHIYHLQVNTKSVSNAYAAHKALNTYYDSIIPLADSLIETYQGMYGIEFGYPEQVHLKNYTTIQDVINYFNYLASYLKEVRYTAFKKEDSNLQNDIDTIVSLIYSTLYKLVNL